MSRNKPHTFHIPVMGLGFTIDTPIKVAKFGITSVVSIIEDQLMEQMREIICREEGLEYAKIHGGSEDHRAKRITAYLDLMQQIVNNQINKIKGEDFDKDQDINKYFELLPDTSEQKKLYQAYKNGEVTNSRKVEQELKEFIQPGAIEVNIMTKVDKTNYTKSGEEMPPEYSDALSALRGFAKSEVNSAVVFSAGMNPRLYSYCEAFPDFFPDENGVINKKIILKVSDYRSALIQGKFLAKKGLWVSEYRIESGINCGGHAFVSNGILFGPILEEFKLKRKDLFDELYAECTKGLAQGNRHPFKETPVLKVTAQGGVGTYEEHNFLLKHYDIDSVGWGSPFLLVPEVTNVEAETLNKLATAQKSDYYISHASPLGVPFHNLKGTSSEIQRKIRISKNKPGSPCYKKFLSANKEFTEKAICTASRQYQNLKIKQLQNSITDASVLKSEIDQVIEKDCLCSGLGASVIMKHNAKPAHNLNAVTICPGPNLAYFSGIYSLKQMVDHIYGRINLLNGLKRFSFFVNELQLYTDYYLEEIKKNVTVFSEKKDSALKVFRNNLFEGIKYYESLIEKIPETDTLLHGENISALNKIKSTLIHISDFSYS